jgi:hypothetical protein
MKKELHSKALPSEFREMAGIEYFFFEEDFIEENVRCIPMIVRFKMDAAGIKLKLAQWSKFSGAERKGLAIKQCSTEETMAAYSTYLAGLVEKYTGKSATKMEVDKHPAWANKNIIPDKLIEKAKEFNWTISVEQWKSLTDLQRFALLKLCKPGHENRNFPRAMKEFNLI